MTFGPSRRRFQDHTRNEASDKPHHDRAAPTEVPDDGHTTVMGPITAVANGPLPPAVTAAMLDARNADNLARHGIVGMRHILVHG